MPTYEYRCSACKHEFEQFQSITAKPIKKCPKCGKNKVDRLISSGAGMIFKGSGFYITDYRSEGYKQAAKSDGGGGSEAAKADGAKSDGAKSEGAKSEGSAAKAEPAKPAAEKPASKKSSKKAS